MCDEMSMSNVFRLGVFYGEWCRLGCYWIDFELDEWLSWFWTDGEYTEWEHEGLAEFDFEREWEELKKLVDRKESE